MKSFIAALRNLVLPFGATTGTRLVLDGVNGKIDAYNASNVVAIDIDSATSTVTMTGSDGSNVKLVGTTYGGISLKPAGAYTAAGIGAGIAAFSNFPTLNISSPYSAASTEVTNVQLQSDIGGGGAVLAIYTRNVTIAGPIGPGGLATLYVTGNIQALASGTGGTITAVAFVGPLTGNVTGNVTGDLTGEVVNTTAWATFTSTWASNNTQPVLGNGTLTGIYKRIGKTIHYTINLTIGSTTTLGVGTYTFSLPSTSAANSSTIIGTLFLTTTSFLLGATTIAPSASVLTPWAMTATATPLILLSALTLPASGLTTGKTLRMSGTYEEA